MQHGAPIPATLGRYEVIKHLATGGMADLLLARTRSANGGWSHVVLKRIPPQQAGDPTFVQMFIDEARIATLLQHPNIVRVHETAEDRGQYFFAMDYVHGEDLRKVLMAVHKRRDQVPIALVTSIVAGAAAGLHHAHKQLGPDHRPLGIVHRDVSPANILIGYDGVVRVADFGIAKAALRTIETRSGTLKGKVSYMSPEQVTGKFVDRRSDVFALGIVLYELATARRLFKGENDFLTMSSIVQGEIPPPSELRRDLPKPLESIIMTALALAPADRFQSAEELRTALAEFTESLGMKMSTSGIADYMKHLFGNRAEPWLVDDEPTHTGEIDFDGSGGGIARVPDPVSRSFALPHTMRAAASAPIVYARANVTDTPVSPNEIDTAPQRAWTENPTGSGSNEAFAWMRDRTSTRSPRRWIPIGAGAAIAVIAAVIIFVRASAKDDDEAQTVQLTATPPPPQPEATPTPAAAPIEEEVDPAEAARAAKAEAAKAAKVEAAAKAEAAKTAKAEAAKAEAARREAAKADAAAKAEAARMAKAEAAKAEAERREAARAEAAAKAEAARVAKAEAAKAEAARREAARAAKAEAARREAVRAAKAEASASASKARTRPRKTDKRSDKGSAWDPDSMFAPK